MQAPRTRIYGYSTFSDNTYVKSQMYVHNRISVIPPQTLNVEKSDRTGYTVLDWALINYTLRLTE